MFFRIVTTKSTPVLKLLESYRDPEGIPRHRVVVSLGNADIPEEDHKIIARMITSRLQYGSTNLFDSVEATDFQSEWVDRIVRQIENERITSDDQQNKPSVKTIINEVDSSAVSHENTSELGPVLVANHAWNELNMDQTLRECGIIESRILAARISVVNRLVDPVPENRLLDWFGSTALGDLLHNRLRGFGKERFYRTSDALLKNHRAIENAVRKQTGALHKPDRTILLYDLTNTYFEGECLKNPKAKRGKNKQKRDDCPQVVIGMVFDTSGFELAHHMFAGNQSDSTSLETILKTMEEIASDSPDTKAHKTLVVMDSGISSAANLAKIRELGYCYLVNDRRPLRTRYKEQFAQRDRFSVIAGRDEKSPVYVRYIEDEIEAEDGSTIKEQVILCRSDNRGEKEKAILSNAEQRLLIDLEKVRTRLESGRFKAAEDVFKALGKCQERHSRAYRYYKIDIDFNNRTMSYSCDTDKRTESDDLCGSYVLRTNDFSLNHEDVWKTYIALTTAENGFRILKGNLGLRPNFHQKEKRVDGHVFVTVLAYQLLRHIMFQLEKQGDVRSWETIRRILKTHAYTTMIIPEKNGVTHRIRKAGNPEEAQKQIYCTLGINWKTLPTSHIVVNAR